MSPKTEEPTTLKTHEATIFPCFFVSSSQEAKPQVVLEEMV